MIRRNTWILVVVFALLVAATLFWQRTKGRDDSLTGEVTPLAVDPLVADLGEASVVGVTLQDVERNTIKLELGDDGEWHLLMPAAPADSSAIGATLSQLNGMTALTTLSSSTPLADLGLSPPQKLLVLDLDSGSQFILNIGKATPTGSGYYVLSNASDRKLYVVKKVSLDSILNWLESPPILPPTPMPTAEAPLETPAP
ncbi:DUF4340 domain-containing protein [Chloroflexota bacterium]